MLFCIQLVVVWHVRDSIWVPVFSDDKKPFHMVRYFCCPGDPLWEMILLTSYSSSDLIMIGGGDKKFSPCVVVSLYGDRRVAWNMSWIFHVSGSQR